MIKAKIDVARAQEGGQDLDHVTQVTEELVPQQLRVLVLFKVVDTVHVFQCAQDPGPDKGQL